MIELRQRLAELTTDERDEIFKFLRSEIAIHPLEEEFNAQAEVILEAISRGSDLTKRGIRGIIAEASFKVEVLEKLPQWQDITPPGDLPFDFKIADAIGEIGIQVKMQRKKNQRPMMANEGYRILSADKYVVETQKTRGGNKDGASTRPYRYGEFEILAVSMHPAANDWAQFRYTVASWLLPDPKDSACILKFQPVPLERNEDWTDSLEECIQWYRSGRQHTISH
ncbi:hypothetical protein BVH03_24415 [Pseudomonas sp. PA15(2017)]|uniref:hypothetical protein n=1 Tax=Pseudomonas sp. PA15(2017) TaxID=1932111 RepID=UPI00095BF82C|nr:hypothetical protein [Pseudomonas sp. PA15(2017)]OLU22383.1 hypothetical protein BVH03_24415 [Pseudomonas sp. PA15(2017)]